MSKNQSTWFMAGPSPKMFVLKKSRISMKIVAQYIELVNMICKDKKIMKLLCKNFCNIFRIMSNQLYIINPINKMQRGRFISYTRNFSSPPSDYNRCDNYHIHNLIQGLCVCLKYDFCQKFWSKLSKDINNFNTGDRSAPCRQNFRQQLSFCGAPQLVGRLFQRIFWIVL